MTPIMAALLIWWCMMLNAALAQSTALRGSDRLVTKVFHEDDEENRDLALIPNVIRTFYVSMTATFPPRPLLTIKPFLLELQYDITLWLNQTYPSEKTISPFSPVAYEKGHAMTIPQRRNLLTRMCTSYLCILGAAKTCRLCRRRLLLTEEGNTEQRDLTTTLNKTVVIELVSVEKILQTSVSFGFKGVTEFNVTVVEQYY